MVALGVAWQAQAAILIEGVYEFPGTESAAPRRVGDEILLVVEFNQGISSYTAGANPAQLPLQTLNGTRRAVCVGLHQIYTGVLMFRYTVVPGDYEAAALADADGDGHAAWQELIAGSNPTNRESVLRTHVSAAGDAPHVTWTPDLGAERVYDIEGRSSLLDAGWGPTNEASRFFRVKVRMP